ncbi:hypothetical protein [Stenotrophomonas sp. GD03654]|uniref:hypothetical protein n=1 Tax=Stenotrophomonas sp. GD03654 TaxID=2975362 RepID=UPI00244B4F68|nr:hypothetical protein [Stenotrophomonas sp. GD03654]MDH2177975.1 hypothetical protein [Stenotrophomonas sp. GD03654]
MWHSSAKQTQKLLESEIASLSAIYDKAGNAPSLEGMVDQIKELTGLNLRLKLFESKVERHREAFDNLSGDYNDLEIGRQVMTNTGIAGPQSRATLPQNMCDMIDSSIPLLNPQLCDVFLERVRERFNLPSDAQVFVRGSWENHAVRMQSVKDDVVTFVHNDTGATHTVAASKVYLDGGERSVSLSSVLRQMCPGRHVNHHPQM